MMCNWFWFVFAARTFSNSVEAVLTIVAIYFWPWKYLRYETKMDSPGFPSFDRPAFLRPYVTPRQLALIIASLAVVLRPTGAIVWFLLGFVHLLELPISEKFELIFKEVVPIGYCSN
jgi:phosphatidylinositol glycan class B